MRPGPTEEEDPVFHPGTSERGAHVSPLLALANLMVLNYWKEVQRSGY